jgi:predicted ABC-type ATPase
MPDGGDSPTFGVPGIGRFTRRTSATGLPFINADVLARELNLDPYAAARMVGVLRREFVARGASFVFETVFSDPVGDKLSFLRKTVRSGYTVVLCYIGISGPDVSEVRVARALNEPVPTWLELLLA